MKRLPIILFALSIGVMLSCKKPRPGDRRAEPAWRGIPEGMTKTCGAWKDGVATCVAADGSLFVCVDGRKDQGCNADIGEVACSRRSAAAPTEYEP